MGRQLFRKDIGLGPTSLQAHRQRHPRSAGCSHRSRSRRLRHRHVSNHGGRNLDGIVSPIEVLPEIVDAAGKRTTVFLDGGIRRSSDVVKALALGATAVMVGRSTLYGVAADGEAGAARARNLP